MGQDFRPKNIESFTSGNFWVVYGRNSSGKTHFIGTFPNLLVVSFKDNGLNTLKGITGAKYIEWEGTIEEIITFCEMYKDSPYDTIAFDTLGVYQNQLMEAIKVALKTKKMTQNMWGDFGEYFSDALMAMKKLSENKNVIVTFHEQPENIEGFENEIIPSVSVAVSGNVIKKTLYGIANYVVHTFIYNYVNPQTMQSQHYFAGHVGVNPFYWTKFQTEHKVPSIVFNPSYEQMMKIKQGEYNE